MLLPDLTQSQIKLLLLRERCEAAATIGKVTDRWVLHPLPSMSGPEKASCLLTDFGDYDPDHLAWLHNKASLHAVDSWFNRIRRRSAMLADRIFSELRPDVERVLRLPARANWQILTILRACHNYIWLADGVKDTPTMRLGLAKAVVVTVAASGRYAATSTRPAAGCQASALQHGFC